jgi:hypothetical protein
MQVQDTTLQDCTGKAGHLQVSKSLNTGTTFRILCVKKCTTLSTEIYYNILTTFYHKEQLARTTATANTLLAPSCEQHMFQNVHM